MSNRRMRKCAVVCIAIALAMGYSTPLQRTGSNNTKPQERRVAATDVNAPLRCELRRPAEGGWWSPASHHHLHFLLFWQTSGVKVYQDWNSWGYYARSFVARDAEGRAYELAARPTEFPMNYPSTHALNAGDFVITNVYLCDGSWYASPKLPSGQPATLSLTGRFRIPANEDAVKHGVWTGEIQSATPVEVYLGKDCVRALNARVRQYDPPLHDCRKIPIAPMVRAIRRGSRVSTPNGLPLETETSCLRKRFWGRAEALAGPRS